MSQFVSILSAEAEPLRRRLMQGHTFEWGQDQANAIDRLKTLLIDSSTLQYFDIMQPIVIQTDTFTVGIGAALLQHRKPIVYAS